MIDREEEMRNNELNSLVLIDSFAVNKIISADLQYNETKVCLLAVSEKYLIEKDEEVNEYFQFIHFIDGKINKEYNLFLK